MRRYAVLAFIVTAWSTTITGCGDDEEPPDPRQQCQSFLNAWCNKNASCAPPTDRARVLEDCWFTIELDIQCENITAIGVTYPDCMNGVSSAACLPEGGVEFPGLCTGILIR
jgi:hypothetical protein